MNTAQRICLVDDDVFVRDALAIGLRDLGFSVRVAPGAAAALDLLERNHVDAVVTDICMPGTSGAELISEARARWPNVTIVAISGLRELNGAPIAEAARRLGADAVLAKPFRASELAAVINDVMRPGLTPAGGTGI